MRIEEHDLYILKGVVEGLEEEKSIDKSIAKKFNLVIDSELARLSTDGDVQGAIKELTKGDSK
jgi:hypothetical protein